MQSERNITNKMRLIKLFRAWSLMLGSFISVFVAATERPNVVLMVADDLGWADVGYHGSPIQTPAIDGLAAQGVALERFYAAPICSPTRAGLLTARDPVRLGIAYDQIHPWYNAGLGKDEYLLSEALQDAGYQTGIIGKWHLGHSQHSNYPTPRDLIIFMVIYTRILIFIITAGKMDMICNSMA